MNVFYDIFLEYPELPEIIQKDQELDAFYGTLFSFVVERLKPLEGEINKEEERQPEVWKGTIICVMRDDEKFINFSGYSESLRLKMLGCFSVDDIRYIIKKIQLIRESRNN